MDSEKAKVIFKSTCGLCWFPPYALAGYSWSLDTNSGMWLIRTDSEGNELWNKTFAESGHEEVLSLVQSRDNGYALAGYTSSYGAGDLDFWLVKTGDGLFVGGQGGLSCFNGTSFSQVLSVPTYIRVLGIYESTLYAGTMLDNPPKALLL